MRAEWKGAQGGRPEERRSQREGVSAHLCSSCSSVSLVCLGVSQAVRIIHIAPHAPADSPGLALVPEASGLLERWKPRKTRGQQRRHTATRRERESTADRQTASYTPHTVPNTAVSTSSPPFASWSLAQYAEWLDQRTQRTSPSILTTNWATAGILGMPPPTTCHPAKQQKNLTQHPGGASSSQEYVGTAVQVMTQTATERTRQCPLPRPLHSQG